MDSGVMGGRGEGVDSGMMVGRDREWTVGRWEGEIESGQWDDGRER